MIWFLLPISCVVHNDVWAYACGKLFGRTQLLRLSPKKTLEGFIGSFFMTIIWAFWFSGFMCRFPQLICPTDTLSLGDSQITCDQLKNPLFLAATYALPPLPPQASLDPIFSTIGIDPPTVLLQQIYGFYATHSTFHIMPLQLHAIIFAAFASLVAPFGGFFASGLKRAHGLKDFGALIPGHGGMSDRMDCQIINGTFTFVYLNYVLFRAAKSCGGSLQGLVMCLALLDDAQRKWVMDELTKVLQNSS